MNIFTRIDKFFVHELWDIDIEGLGKGRAFLFKLLRLLYVGGKEFLEGQLNLWATSLVYTTILSFVPLLAVSFSILKAMGVHHQMEPLLLNFLSPFGEQGIEITNRIIEFVENINVGVLGSLGLLFLLYSVISLVVKIENAFNYIWTLSVPRSIARKFSDYISVLVTGPIFLFSAISLTASISSTTIMQRISQIEPFGSILFYVGKIVPYLFVILAFTFVYIFIPNTKVRFRSALVGGIFGGVLWQSSGWLFASFVVKSTKYAAIYSGFAILILFFIWLYISWLILLVGGYISYYHQYPQLFNIKAEGIKQSNRLRERLMLLVMFYIGLNHYLGQRAWTLDRLVRKIGIPIEPLFDTIKILKEEGFITETSDEPPGYLPSRDIGTITIYELISAARISGTDTEDIEKRFLSLPVIDEVIERIESSIKKELDSITLEELIKKFIAKYDLDHKKIL